MTTATHNTHDNTPEAVLFMAFELSENTWKLGFTLGHGQKPRERTIAARDPKRVLEEVRHAKGRFGLPETAPVVSCDSAKASGQERWVRRTQVGEYADAVLPRRASGMACNETHTFNNHNCYFLIIWGNGASPEYAVKSKLQ